jgi:hypothetical protein
VEDVTAALYSRIRHGSSVLQDTSVQHCTPGYVSAAELIVQREPCMDGKTWSDALRTGHRLRMTECKLLRRIRDRK